MDSASLLAQLSHPDYNERRRAEDALVALGESAVLPLIDVVETQPFVPALRAASALSRLGDMRGLLPVARLLLRENNTVRNDIIMLLAQWNSLERVGEGELIAIAHDYEDAFFSLDTLEQKLLKRIREYSPGWTPPVFVASTGNFNGSEDISFLIQALRSTRHEQRNAATAKLIERGRAAVPELIEALSIDSPLVRFRAVEALGKIGDSRAVEPLLKLAHVLSLDFDVQRAATEALQNLARKRMQTPEPDDVPALILLVRHLRFSQPEAANDAAVALTTLARRHPSPSLRGALKWLRSLGLALTPTFKEAYQTIEEATKQWKDLPLTADSPRLVNESLPIPVTEENNR